MTKVELVFETTRPNFQRGRRLGIGWALPKSFGPIFARELASSNPADSKSRMEIFRHLDSFTVLNKFLVLVAERAGFEIGYCLGNNTLPR